MSRCICPRCPSPTTFCYCSFENTFSKSCTKCVNRLRLDAEWNGGLGTVTSRPTPSSSSSSFTPSGYKGSPRVACGWCPSLVHTGGDCPSYGTRTTIPQVLGKGLITSSSSQGIPVTGYIMNGRQVHGQITMQPAQVQIYSAPSVQRLTPSEYAVAHRSFTYPYGAGNMSNSYMPYTPPFTALHVLSPEYSFPTGASY
jgi:hypothetical protein